MIARPRSGHWLIPLFAGFLLIPVALANPSVSAQGSASANAGEIAVFIDKTDVSLHAGESMTMTSTITNSGTSATAPLVASLNFTSMDSGTYVDPEDWAPNRTRKVDGLEPGASTELSWTINPALDGNVAAYVVILPDSADLTVRPLVSSPAMYLHVSTKKALNPGGVLPVVLIVPAVLGVVFSAMQFGSRRRRFGP
jgi:uncharacterized membrane protein